MHLEIEDACTTYVHCCAAGVFCLFGVQLLPVCIFDPCTHWVRALAPGTPAMTVPHGYVRGSQHQHELLKKLVSQVPVTLFPVCHRS